MTLRIAIVPLADIRKEGLDVRVAPPCGERHVTYAMFAGGGAAWAEAADESGGYRYRARHRRARGRI